MRLYTLLGAAILFSSIVLPATAANQINNETDYLPDQLDISVGSVTRPVLEKSTPNSFHASATWNTDWFTYTSASYTRTMRFEVGTGLNQTDAGNVRDITAAPVLHYQQNISGNALFLEASIGLTHISSAHWKPGHYMGSHLMFADRLGVGYDMGPLEVSLNFFHISNGGATDPNPGADMLLLRTSFKL